MHYLVLPALTVFVFGTVLRAHKRRDSIDWKSRGMLLVSATLACLMLGRWLEDLELSGLESVMATGQATTGSVLEIATRYQPVFLPLYIAGMALVIDLLARLTRRLIAQRVGEADRSSMLWRSVCANALLFVGTPGVLYAWTAAAGSSGSILSNGAPETATPVIVAYGAPTARGTATPVIAAYAAPARALVEGRWDVGFDRFLFDASPWLTLAVLLGCFSTIYHRTPDVRKLSEYFATPRAASSRRAMVFRALETWRGAAAIVFTLGWVMYVTVSRIQLNLSLSFQYLWLPLLVLGTISAVIAIIALLVYAVRAGRSS